MIVCEFSIFNAVEMWGDQSIRQQFGHGEDKRIKNEDEDQWAISKSREDLIDSMLNLIVNHKKSLKLIPQCSHPDTAREWASKRGLSVTTPDLDNDPATQEVVVWDKSGRYPYVVNGYQLERSDYPTRNAYWGTHQTAESRMEEPMDEWVSNKVYNVKTRDDNKWIVDAVDVTQLGRNIERYGYGMPTKPKKMMTPYAIFSKLIAPLVKRVWATEQFYNAFGITTDVDDKASYVAEMFRKIVSPISIYRALYLRLVEQKYFFKQCDANGGNPIAYSAFKKYMKTDRGKADFYNWFYKNYLIGDDKGEFNRDVINIDIVCENLVPMRKEGEPVRNVDVLLNLLGEGNWTNNEAFIIDTDGNSATLKETLKSDKISKLAYTILEDKNHQSHKDAKKRLDKAKRISQISSEKFIGKANVDKIVSDRVAYEAYRKSLAKTGTPNHMVPGSPAKGGSAQEAPPQPPAPKGQRRMDDFFTPQ